MISRRLLIHCHHQPQGVSPRLFCCVSRRKPDANAFRLIESTALPRSVSSHQFSFIKFTTREKIPMVSQTVLEDNWNEIKSTLKSKWQQLSDHELRGFKGTADDLVQMIASRTGQAKTAIENQLEEMVTQGRSIQKQVGQYVSGAATQTPVSRAIWKPHSRSSDTPATRPPNDIMPKWICHEPKQTHCNLAEPACWVARTPPLRYAFQ